MADDGQLMEMLLNKVSALEAELKEVKGVLAQVLALVTALQSHAGDSIDTGLSPLLELPVEILQRILYFLDDRALYYASKTCTAMYNTSGSNMIWKEKFAAKWPAFYETFLLEQRAKEQEEGHSTELAEGTYKRLFKETSLGRRSWKVQVYKRDLNEGFRASFTDAAVSLDPFTLTYVAIYHPSPVQGAALERGIEWWRIRSVPPELWGIDTNQIWDDTPLEELTVGKQIEVQWAYTPELPLCWWYGEIAAVEDEPEELDTGDAPKKKRIALTFLQYPEESIWASATISYPNTEKVVLPVRGFYGGIRVIKRPSDLAFWANRKKTSTW